jgi:hypothetical protein
MRENFLFVRQCILSCQNLFQLDCCFELIQLFKKKYIKEVVLIDELASLHETLEGRKILISCEEIDA